MAFGGFLKEDTAVDILIGPFLDKTDGVTAETGLTLDVELSKNGQALANKNDATAPVHDAAGDVDGYYNCELDATDTNTCGQLTVVVHNADALPVRHDYQVVEETVYDALFKTSAAAFGTDFKALISTDAQDLSGSLDVNTKTLTDGAIAAAKLGADCITNAKIADDAIAVENIKDAAITAAKLASDCITAAKIANAAIDNATFAADVGSTAYATNIIALAVRKVLDELNLDHLMKVAVADRDVLAEVVDDTVLANIMTKTDGDTSDFDHATDSLEAVRDKQTDIEADTNETQITQTASQLNDASATTSVFITDLTETTDDHYNNMTIIFTSGALAGQARRIHDYAGATKTITVYPAFTEAPADDDTFVILPLYHRTPSAGALEITYTVKEDDEDTGDPIEGVSVWITRDEAGADVIWSGVTNSSGVLVDPIDGTSKPFVDAGTFYFWRQKSGYTFVNPDSETFS